MIRENWRAAWGPFDLAMPVDAFPSTRDWAHPGPPWPMYRADFLDRLNEDGTFGSTNPAEAGGSGIDFGRAWENLDATLVQIGAMAKSVKPDNEHAPREYIDAFAWYEYTHDPKAARLISGIASRRIAQWQYNGVPFLEHLREVNSSSGLEVNGREFGHLMILKAMAHKVSRTSSVWSLQALDVCEQAALPGTGQVIVDTHTGIDQPRLFYAFHASILAIGALALAYRLGKPAPKWVLDYATSLYLMPAYGLSAWPSPPAFMYTKGIRLKACTGAEQKPDPAGAYWGALCVALEKVTGDPEWINRAYRFGCGVSQNDGQERRDSMLLRGRVQ